MTDAGASANFVTVAVLQTAGMRPDFHDIVAKDVQCAVHEEFPKIA